MYTFDLAAAVAVDIGWAAGRAGGLGTVWCGVVSLIAASWCSLVSTTTLRRYSREGKGWEVVGEMSWGLLVLCCAALFEGYELGLGGRGCRCSRLGL